MMPSLEQFVIDTNKAKNSEEIFALYQKALIEFGYDSICYCLVTDHPSFGLKADHGIMQNYSEDWVKHYSEKNYKSIDPVLQVCSTSNKPFAWQTVTEKEGLRDDERLLMHEADDAKLHDGVAVPIHGVNGELAAIGLASTSGKTDINQDILYIIRAFSLQFHLAFAEKEAQEIQDYSHVKLSDREREILQWAAEGKSDDLIADFLGISYGTVRYHMNNAYKKLDAYDRTFATVKAIRHGLILPSYLERR